MMLSHWFLLLVLVFGVNASPFRTREVKTLSIKTYHHIPISFHGKHEFVFQIKACEKAFLWLHSGTISKGRTYLKIEIARDRVIANAYVKAMHAVKTQRKRQWPCNVFTTVHMMWSKTSLLMTEGCHLQTTILPPVRMTPGFNDVSLSSEGPATWRYDCPKGQLMQGNNCSSRLLTCKTDAACRIVPFISRVEKCCNRICRKGNCPVTATGRPCDPSTSIHCHDNNVNKPTGTEENRPSTNSGGSTHPNKAHTPSAASPQHGQRHDNTSAVVRDNLNPGEDNSGKISQPTGEHVKGILNQKMIVDGNSTHIIPSDANMSDKESYQEGFKNISKALGSDGAKVTAFTFTVTSFLLGQVMFAVLFWAPFHKGILA